MAGGTPSPDRNTRFVESSRGILSYKQLAPLLAERVLVCEEAIVAGAFEVWLLDERLLLELHQRICGDLVPDWSGRWRTAFSSDIRWALWWLPRRVGTRGESGR